MSTQPAVHPVTRLVAEVTAALEAARDADPTQLSAQAHREALIELTRLTGRLEAVRLGVIDAAAGPHGIAQTDGARSPAAWLAPRTRTGYAPARRAEALADALNTRWHTVAAALAAGDVRLEQAHTIVKALDALPADEVPAHILAKAEQHLIDLAAIHDPRALETLGAKILEIVAPDTYDDLERTALEDAQQRANRATRLTFHRRGDGATDIKARIPDGVASRLKTLLDAWTSPRHIAARGSDSERDTSQGIDPATGLRLPHERLLGHAFCSLLESVDPTRLPSHGGAATKIVITVSLDTLRTGLGLATLATSGADDLKLPASEVRRLACQSDLIPAVLGSKSEVLDLGRTSRLFTAAQRHAKMTTATTCAGEGCTIPATWCEAHHARTPWAAGGTTDLDDLEFLCSWHHQRIHDPTYATSRMPNGDIRFARRR